MTARQIKSRKQKFDILAVESPLLRLLFVLFATIGDIVITSYKKLHTKIQTRLPKIQDNYPTTTQQQRFLPNFKQLLFVVGKTTRILLQRFFYFLKPVVFDLLHFLIFLYKRLTDWLSRLFIRSKSKILSLSRITMPRLQLPKIRIGVPRLRIRLPKSLFYFFLGVFTMIVLVFIPYNLYIFVRYLPNPRLLTSRFIPVTTQIFDRNGILLYEIHGDEDRKPVKLSDIPLFVKQATIAIEDKDFYHHNGFSVSGISRAVRETVLKKNLQGGSTITQQLIKNSLLTPEISILRKIREIILAFWTEKIYSKDQILEMYLNQVPYGGTAWGIEAASERYFGKKIQDVTLSEAAFLAGLPAAPTLYSPYGSRPELAKERQIEVLRRMVEDHYITQEMANGGKSVKIDVKPEIVDIKAPHFVMYVRELIAKKFGDRLLDQGGLRITTTLDLSLQEKVQTIVNQNITKLAKLNVGNGAALVTNPRNGDILAMVGSKDYFDTVHDGNVNVTLSPRQPGSSIKVVNYAAALENGMTAATVISDAPISYPLPLQPAYTPVNYDGRFHGNVTLRTALGSSYNVPAVKTLNRIGVKTMVAMGQRLGITTWTDENRYGLSLTLGAGEVRMLDMAAVYGALAGNGEQILPDPLLEVVDYTGRIYYQKTIPKPTLILPPGIAFILSDILSDNTARTPAFGPNSLLVIPGKTVAVKTGTTNEKRDNWTIGYTPSYVTTVWVGNNDNTPMDPLLSSGVTGAAPIWHDIMTMLLEGKTNEPFIKPETIVEIPCFNRKEYFIRGTEPKNGCGIFPSPSTKIPSSPVGSLSPTAKPQ